MIAETTWAPVESKRTNYVWNSTSSGISFFQTRKVYTVPWSVFFKVYEQARSMMQDSGRPVVVGTSMTSPPTGSLGAWVASSGLVLERGAKLTPRHLCSLGLVYGRMGSVENSNSGNCILWIVR